MLGIVILNYKSFEDTIKCVKSILDTTKKTYFHIYIIDNDSPDQSYNELFDFYLNNEEISVIQSGENGGYSFGNNIGIKKAAEDQCDAILISNTDIVYQDGSIDSMYEKLFDSDDLAVVGPDMIDAQGQYCQIRLSPPSLKNYWMTKKPFNLLNKNQQIKRNYDEDYKFRGMVQGSSFLIKSDVLKKIDYLDENVFLFGEELIMANKLDQLNLNTLIDSEALILHNHSATISKEGIAFERYHMYFSTLYVLRKYVNISNFQLTLGILYSLGVFATKSIRNMAYRKKSIKLFRKLNGLYNI